jgi:hypothetical protein
VFQPFAEQTPFGATAGPRTSRCSPIENDYVTGVVLPCGGGLWLT